MGRAGAETALLELLKHLDSPEYDISLYVIMGQGEMIGKLPPCVKLLNPGFNPHSVLSRQGKWGLMKTVCRAFFRNGGQMNKIRSIGKSFSSMRRRGKVQTEKLLWRMLSEGSRRFEEQFDLAVAWLEGASAYYVAEHVKAARKCAFIHIDYESAGYTREMDQNCWDSFEKIFMVSREVKEHFLAVYPEYADKAEIFHNLVDQEGIRRQSMVRGGFSDGREGVFSGMRGVYDGMGDASNGGEGVSNGIGNASDGYEGKRLLTVGRLTYQKAYDIAIDAMKILKDRGCKARWYVLGEGDQRKALEKKIAALHLEEDFVLLGAVENPYPYYVQADIYVHATRFEGKSIAIQEAQTLGCAVIASDCNGNREQIEDGVDGILCQLTPEGIAESIETLLQNEELRNKLGKAAERKNMAQEQELQKLLALLT
ncbi:MAG TPA: glycosyltransferase [Lachnospiraceae bacterium]|nr:glycosyltransferase [Lachnospiraceae bacterium]